MINKKLLVVCLTPFVLGMNLSFSAESTANAGEQITQTPENTQGNDNPNSQQVVSNPNATQGEPDQGDLLNALFNTDVQTQENTVEANPHENIQQTPVTDQPVQVAQEQAPVVAEQAVTQAPAPEVSFVPQAESAPIASQPEAVNTQPANEITPEDNGEFMRQLFNEEETQTPVATPATDQPVQVAQEQAPVVAEQTVAQTPVPEASVVPQAETAPVANQPETANTQPVDEITAEDNGEFMRQLFNEEETQTPVAPPVTEPVQVAQEQSPVVAEQTATEAPAPEASLAPQEETTPVANQPEVANTQPANEITEEDNGEFMRQLFNEEEAQTPVAAPVTDQPVQVAQEQIPVVAEQTATEAPAPETSVAPQEETTPVAKTPVPQSDIEKAAEHIRSEAEEMIENTQTASDSELKAKVDEVDASIDETTKKVEDISTQVSESSDQISDFVLMMDARLGNIEKSLSELNSSEGTEQPNEPVTTDKIKKEIVTSEPANTAVDQEKTSKLVVDPVETSNSAQNVVNEPITGTTESDAQATLISEAKEITLPETIQDPFTKEASVQAGKTEDTAKADANATPTEIKVLPEAGTSPDLVAKEVVAQGEKTEDTVDADANAAPVEPKVPSKAGANPESVVITQGSELDPNLRAYIDRRVKESVNQNFAVLQRTSLEDRPIVDQAEQPKVVNESEGSNLVTKALVDEQKVQGSETGVIPASHNETESVNKVDSDIKNIDEERSEKITQTEDINAKPLSADSEGQQIVPETKSTEAKNEGNVEESDEVKTVASSSTETAEEADVKPSTTEKQPNATGETANTETIADSQKGESELRPESMEPKDSSETADQKLSEEADPFEESKNIKETDDSVNKTTSEKTSTEEPLNADVSEVKDEKPTEEENVSDSNSVKESPKAADSGIKGEGVVEEKKVEESIPANSIETKTSFDEVNTRQSVSQGKVTSADSEATQMLKNTMNQLRSVRNAIENLSPPEA